MSLMTLSNDGNVAIITFTNGANSHNLAFAQQLESLLKEVEAEKSYKALVLASSDEKSWSQGIDVPWMMMSIQSGKHDEVKTFLHTMDNCYKLMLQFPMPVIAAMNGHTFGNGSVLACAADFRFMRSDKGYFCFPEVDMSIPFIPALIDIVLKSLPAYRYNEMLLSGRKVGAQELLDDHFLQGIAEGNDGVLQAAIEYGSSFNKSRAIFAEHKRRFHKPVLEALEEKNPPMINEIKILL